MADRCVRLRGSTGNAEDSNSDGPRSVCVDWRLRPPKNINTTAGRRDLVWSGFHHIQSKPVNFSREDQMACGLPSPRQRFALYVLVPDCPWNSLWGSRHGTGEATRAFPLPFWSVCHVVSMDVRPVHPVDPFVLSFARICEEKKLATAFFMQEKVAQIGVQLQLIEEALLEVSSGDAGNDIKQEKQENKEDEEEPSKKLKRQQTKMSVVLSLAAEQETQLVAAVDAHKKCDNKSVLLNQHLFRRMEELAKQADELSERLTDESLKLHRLLLSFSERYQSVAGTVAVIYCALLDFAALRYSGTGSSGVCQDAGALPGGGGNTGGVSSVPRGFSVSVLQSVLSILLRVEMDGTEGEKSSSSSSSSDSNSDTTSSKDSTSVMLSVEQLHRVVNKLLGFIYAVGTPWHCAMMRTFLYLEAHLHTDERVRELWSAIMQGEQEFQGERKINIHDDDGHSHSYVKQQVGDMLSNSAMKGINTGNRRLSDYSYRSGSSENGDSDRDYDFDDYSSDLSDYTDSESMYSDEYDEEYEDELEDESQSDSDSSSTSSSSSNSETGRKTFTMQEEEDVPVQPRARKSMVKGKKYEVLSEKKKILSMEDAMQEFCIRVDSAFPDRHETASSLPDRLGLLPPDVPLVIPHDAAVIMTTLAAHLDVTLEEESALATSAPQQASPDALPPTLTGRASIGMGSPRRGSMARRGSSSPRRSTMGRASIGRASIGGMLGRASIGGRRMSSVDAAPVIGSPIMDRVCEVLAHGYTWLMVDLADAPEGVLADLERLLAAMHRVPFSQDVMRNARKSMAPQAFASQNRIKWHGSEDFVEVRAPDGTVLHTLKGSSRLILFTSSDSQEIPEHVLRRCVCIQNVSGFFGIMPAVAINADDSDSSSDSDGGPGLSSSGGRMSFARPSTTDTHRPSNFAMSDRKLTKKVRTRQGARAESHITDIFESDAGSGMCLSPVIVRVLNYLSYAHPFFTARSVSLRDEGLISTLRHMAGILQKVGSIPEIDSLDEWCTQEWVMKEIVSKASLWVFYSALHQMRAAFLSAAKTKNERQVKETLGQLSAKVGDLLARVAGTLSTLSSNSPFWLRLELAACARRLQGARMEMSSCYHALMGDVHWDATTHRVYMAVSRARAIWFGGGGSGGGVGVRSLSSWVRSLEAHVLFLTNWKDQQVGEPSLPFRVGSVRDIKAFFSSYGSLFNMDETELTGEKSSPPSTPGLGPLRRGSQNAVAMSRSLDTDFHLRLELPNTSEQQSSKLLVTDLVLIGAAWNITKSCISTHVPRDQQISSWNTNPPAPGQDNQGEKEKYRFNRIISSFKSQLPAMTLVAVKGKPNYATPAQVDKANAPKRNSKLEQRLAGPSTNTLSTPLNTMSRKNSGTTISVPGSIGKRSSTTNNGEWDGYWYECPLRVCSRDLGGADLLAPPAAVRPNSFSFQFQIYLHIFSFLSFKLL